MTDITIREFKITLLSNVKDVPTNKINSFVTPLREYINLVGEWEVALINILLPETANVKTPQENEIRPPSVFVNLDILEDQFVANAKVPMIANVPNAATTEKDYFHQCANLIYLPVRNKSFKNVRVELTDPYGNDIKFKNVHGLVSLDLKFRPRQFAP